MKNLFYLFFLTISLFSCSDELVEQKNENLQTENRSSVYAPTSITSKTDAHKAIAYAVSKLFDSDQQFKTFILQNMVREQLPMQQQQDRDGRTNTNQSSGGGGNGNNGNNFSGPIRLKDLLIYTIIGDPVRKAKINEILKTLLPFITVGDPVRWLLEIDPIMAINMPMHTEVVCDYEKLILDDPDLEYPTIVEDYNERIDYIYSNGNLEKKDMDNFHTCGIHIKTAIYIELVDPDDFSICGGGSLRTVMGDDYVNCTAVANNLKSKPIFPLTTNCVLVDKINDVQNIYNTFCNPLLTPPVNPPNGPNGGPNSGPVCPRWVVSTNHSYNSNLLMAIFNIQWATYWFFDNQPCIEHETEFAFRLVRNAMIFSAPSTLRFIDIHLLHNQLVFMQPVVVKKSRWPFKPRILSTKFNKQTYNVPDMWVIMPTIQPINIIRNLFADNDDTQNNWTPESQGNKVDIAWHERDAVYCSSGTNSNTSFNIGGSLNLGVGDVSLGTVTWGQSTSNSQSYTSTAANDVQIGIFELSYCQNPSWPSFDKNKIYNFYAFENLIGSNTGDKLLSYTYWYK